MAGSNESLIINTDRGLYCPQGDFYIDPWKKVARALITHAHSDHARSGSKDYLTASDGLYVLRLRLGAKASIQTLPYGEQVTMGGVKVSFHSAGHVLGSAQVRLEHRGRIWVVSGDYKTRTDPTCAPFEQVKCHCFITESTFGLPIYRWPDPAQVAHELNSWWEDNRRNGRASLVFAYSFGKAQRLLAMADPSIGPIYVHGTVDKMNEAYIASGVNLPVYTCLNDDSAIKSEKAQNAFKRRDNSTVQLKINAYALNRSDNSTVQFEKGERALNRSDNSTVQFEKGEHALNRSAGGSPAYEKHYKHSVVESNYAGALIIAPPAVSESAWMQKLGEVSTSFASGWMRIRASRRRQPFDRGFVLSDHADWTELLEVISQSEAEEIIVTHGYVAPLVRHLNEIGVKAEAFQTRYAGEQDVTPNPGILRGSASSPSVFAEAELEAALESAPENPA